MTGSYLFASRGRRPSMRVRLTLLYGGSFLVAGAVLMAIMYLLVRNQLRVGPGVEIFPTTRDLPLEGPAVAEAPTGTVLADVEDFLDRTLNTLLWQSALVLLVAALLAVGLGWVLAGRALAPLQKVTDTARRVSARGLHERIALVGPDDEVKQLADTFDAMLERLDRAFDAQRRFVGNASHELRTPLAINRTLVEVAAADPAASEDVRRLAAPLLATSARSERLIDGLLLLARSEQEVTGRRPVDLADVVRGVVGGLLPPAAERHIDVRTQLAPAMAMAEPVLLERLVMNLLQNAIRHNVDGGWADVRTEVRNGTALLIVANTGPVVPGYDIDGLFEPFRRGTDRVGGAEQGFGLGLSIVRAVAHAHSGEVHAQPREGGGLVVRVSLPTGGSNPREDT